MFPERRRAERSRIALRVVEVAHQGESRGDIGAEHVRPWDQLEQRHAGEEQPRVEHDFLEDQAERDAE